MRKRIISFFIIMVMCLNVIFSNVVKAAVCEPLPKLSTKKVVLQIGKKKKIKVKNVQSWAKIKWTSSNKKVVKVSKNGKLIAKGVGKATIKVKIKQDVTTTVLKCKVTVGRMKK